MEERMPQVPLASECELQESLCDTLGEVYDRAQCVLYQHLT